MVTHCVAYKCNNLHDKRNNIQFHSFPLKRPDILKRWVKAIRRENWEPTSSSKLCSSHFLESDYQNRPGAVVKLLKRDAVPSIFYMPEHVIKEEPCLENSAHNDHHPPRIRKILKRLEDSVDSDDEPPEKLIKTEICVEEPIITIKYEDAPMQSSLDLPPTTVKYVDEKAQPSMCLQVHQKFRKKIKALREKVRRRDIKISAMSHLLDDVCDSRRSKENLRSILESNFAGFLLELIINQKTNEKTTPTQRKYSEAIKEFSQTLYCCSPKAYNFVRRKIILPHPRSIRLEIQKPKQNKILKFEEEQVPTEEQFSYEIE